MSIFKPDNINESIRTIDTEKLLKRGLTNLIIDIEDTIVPKAKWEMTEEALSWLNSLKARGFKICFLSNTFHARNSRTFAQKAGIPLVAPAFKPLPFSFRRAMKILGAGKNNTAVIGDQLFMDILGGNIAGLHTILVKHMSEEKNRARKLMRHIEKKVLNHNTQ